MVLDLIGSILSSIIVPLVVIAAAIIAIIELTTIMKANRLTAFLGLYKYLQQEYVRKARGTLFELSKNKFEFDIWSKQDIKQAEIVCHTFDLAGVMLINRLIKEKLVINTWRRSIVKLWVVAYPMIDHYRKTRNAPNLWEGFELVYNKAKDP